MEPRDEPPATPLGLRPETFDDDLLRAEVHARLFATGAPPQRIGRFSVLRRLGAGGMGVVYVAFDDELDRKVAIKLLHVTDGGSEGSSRLVREAQAMARVAHPNVVAVYDVGRHADRVFIAMEFVRGKTLRAWLADERGGWRRVVDVFEQAGRGLSAAHRAGLVHRDFKPDNVMIDEEERARVMDFGLARADLERDREPEPDVPLARTSTVGTALTRTGAIVGTPAYMAPEQIQGDPSTAKGDQFAFCVALWEALFGERPFAGATLAVLVQNVREGRLRPPPRTSDVPTWLRRVVERGLAHAPELRFADMDALLHALERRRRSRVAVPLAAMALVGTALATAVTLRPGPDPCAGVGDSLAAAWNDERRGELEAAFAATQTVYAGETFARTAERLDHYAATWTDASTRACRASTELPPELRVAQTMCLEDARRRLVAAVDVLSTADRDVVVRAVATVSDLPALERCEDRIRLGAVVQPPADGRADEVAAIEDELARVAALRGAGRYEDAMEAARAVLPRARATEYGPLVGRALVEAGNVAISGVPTGATEEELREAYGLLLGARDGDGAIRAAIVLAHLLGDQGGRSAEARAWAAVHAEAVLAWPGVDPTLRIAQQTVLGTLARLAGDFDGAATAFERALAEAEVVQEDDIATTLQNLGGHLAERGDFDGALVLLERSVAEREAKLGPDHPELVATLNNIGSVYYMRGRYEEARTYYDRALDLAERTLPADTPVLAEIFNNRAATMLAQGDVDGARAQHERALAAWISAVGPDHPRVALSLANLGDILLGEGDLPGARAHYQRALAIYERVTADNPDAAPATRGLAAVAHDSGDAEDEERLLVRAIALYEAGGASGLDLADTRFALAQLLRSAGRDPARAVALAEQARAAYVDAGPDGAADHAAIVAWLASAR